MGKINVLSFEIANLIAAGEVVERPSSVLKELIENSIDSGATRICAEIKKGGVSLIRVTDNGCGMDKEDLPIALKRHATSKISSKIDLEKIDTLGFRGEALAAIASVSVLTIISKTKKAEEAAMLTSEGGEIVDVSDVSAGDGTTVVVENLFYNVPARRKFLKKDSTEAMNVAALVEKVALSRPDISMQLLIDGEEKFKTPGNGKLKDTIYSIFGKDFASKLIEVSGEASGVRVSGYVGRSDNVRKNRNLQNVFINSRYVKSMTAMAAIEKAYTSYIAPEAFPTCVLFIEMSPSMVDVNVHPAKLEVKFSDERVVFEAIYYTVKNALEEHEYRPDFDFLEKKNRDEKTLASFVPIGENTKGEQISVKPYFKEAGFTASKESFAPKYSENKSREYERPISFASGSFVKPKNVYTNDGVSMSPRESLEVLERYSMAKPETIAKEADESIKEASESLPYFEYKLVGEAFDCYVIVEYDNSLLIIDKHAAHERVIFEDLKKNQEADKRIASQELLLPITVIPSSLEISIAEEFKKELEAVGFSYSVGASSIDITAIPQAISARDAEKLFVDMLDEIENGLGKPEITEKIRREKTLYQIACKAAIKGGRVYDRAIIDWLIRKLLALPDITVCPHGRPVAYKLLKNKLDRQFDRIK